MAAVVEDPFQRSAMYFFSKKNYLEASEHGDQVGSSFEAAMASFKWAGISHITSSALKRADFPDDFTKYYLQPG